MITTAVVAELQAQLRKMAMQAENLKKAHEESKAEAGDAATRLVAHVRDDHGTLPHTGKQAADQREAAEVEWQR